MIQNPASLSGPSPLNFEKLDLTRSWLFGSALPYWTDFGIDRKYGGFVEYMHSDGRPAAASYKRTRVSARQVYVFSHAAVLGSPGASEAAEHGIRFLLENHKGPRPGSWYRSVDREGRVLDATADLYDLAFVMFALAWWFRLSGDPRAVVMASETLDHIRAVLTHPSGAGFLQDENADGVYLQNPHMHLLEALVELSLVTSEEKFTVAAAELVKLFRTKLAADGILREFYDADWSPCPGELGRLVEPGHMAEWAWLLHRYDRATGDKSNELVTSLMNFVITASFLRPDGLLVDAVFEDCRPMKACTRLWPQTEMLKGLIAYCEVTGNDASFMIERTRSGLFERFLDPAPHGCWIDHFDAEGSPIVDKIPASSLYHLMLGLTEYLQFETVPRFSAPSLGKVG